MRRNRRAKRRLYAHQQFVQCSVRQSTRQDRLLKFVAYKFDYPILEGVIGSKERHFCSSHRQYNSVKGGNQLFPEGCVSINLVKSCNPGTALLPRRIGEQKRGLKGASPQKKKIDRMPATKKQPYKLCRFPL